MKDFGTYDGRNKSSSRGGFFSHLMVGIIGAVIGGILVLTFAPAALLERSVPKEETNLSEGERVIIPKIQEVSHVTAIAKRVTPAVVGIRTTEFRQGMFFGRTKVEGVGSGVIVDKSGYIITNNHVANFNTADITVYLIDGRTVSASPLWTDPSLDLTILKVDAENLQTAEVGDSDSLQVGELAVAIGNPLGLRFERSVTSGIISALNRSIPVDENKFMEDLIQTDASINQGNSGGPLINSRGEVIGINTIKVGEAEGMGFAVPINVAVPVIKSLVETGEFKTPYIGITGIDKEIADYYNYKLAEGIFVLEIDRNGPAYRAGIREGDIILEIDGKTVNTLASLKGQIFSAGEGKGINVKHKDKDGNVKTVTVTLSVLGES